MPPDQRRHRVRRRAVHPDLAVPVEGHEPPRRVDERVDHGQVEAVPLGDRAPVVDARAAQRVGADAHAGVAGSRRCRRRSAGRRRTSPRKSYGVTRPSRARANGDPADALEVGPDQLVGAVRRSRSVASVSAGPPWGGLYLKPPSRGGLCDGRDDDAVGQAAAGRAGRRWRARIAWETAGRRRVAVARRRPAPSRRWRPAPRAPSPRPARTARGCRGR